MRVTTDVIDGFRTCAADRTQLDEDCPGYKSEPVKVVREEVFRTFGDRDPRSSAQPSAEHPLVLMESDSLVYLRAADERDNVCPYCGGPVSISVEPRPTYARLHEQGADEAVRRARGERRLQEAHAAAADRQAAALEALAAGADVGRVAALEDEVARLRALLTSTAKVKT